MRCYIDAAFERVWPLHASGLEIVSYEVLRRNNVKCYCEEAECRLDGLGEWVCGVIHIGCAFISLDDTKCRLIASDIV